MARSQLDSPIGLGITRLSGQDPDNAISGRLLMKALRLYLRHGMLYYNDKDYVTPGNGDYGPMNHLFPITPVTLFEGGVVGSERIVTSISGTFHWPGAKTPKVLAFGPDGTPQNGGFLINQLADGWEITLQIKDWSDIAVIEPAD